MDMYSLFVNGVSIPVKTGSVSHTQYMGKKKTTQVIINGQRDTVASENAEDAQEIKFDIPEFYQDSNVADMLRSALAASGKKGADVTLKKDGAQQNFRSCSLTDIGEIKDDGEPYMSITLSGTHQAKGV